MLYIKCGGESQEMSHVAVVVFEFASRWHQGLQISEIRHFMTHLTDLNTIGDIFFNGIRFSPSLRRNWTDELSIYLCKYERIVYFCIIYKSVTQS